MRYFSTDGETYCLVPLNQQICAKSDCTELATHILIGENNKFVEFYCKEHGELLQRKLEDRYEFHKSQKTIRTKIVHKQFSSNIYHKIPHVIRPKSRKLFRLIERIEKLKRNISFLQYQYRQRGDNYLIGIIKNVARKLEKACDDLNKFLDSK